MAKISFTEASASTKTDVAIVGAGVSGLYAAWRLLSEDKAKHVTVIERLNRTGGRLDTDIVEVNPGEIVREEEGGMRFNFGMTELMTLAAALDLCKDIVPFPMGSANDTNRFFLRGRNFTVADAAASGQMIWSEIYNLSEAERGLSPVEIVTSAFDKILYANGVIPSKGNPPEFWTKVRNEFSWNGTLMRDWQVWGLLRDMGHTEECIQMLSQTIGFAGPFKSMANAGDAFQILADFPKDPSYYTFEKGFSTLPNALVEALDAMGDRCSILLSTNVDAVTKSGDCFTLSVTEAPEHVNARPSLPGGEVKKIEAGKVIVAAATKGAEDLFQGSPAFRDGPNAEKLWDALNSALGMKLLKINLYFDSPWWEDGTTQRPPVQFGPNFTDLPINAIYPFYSLPEQNRVLAGDPPKIRDAAAALTIYCDFSKTNFWHGLQPHEPKFSSPLQEKENEKVPQVMYGASQDIVDAAKRQIAVLFGTVNIPDPVLTSYRLWDGQEDFEFAYHQWKLGVDDEEVRRYLANPLEDVYFCNEAISDMHGWVNGSLRSTNLVLAHFGIQPMSNDPCIGPDQAEPTLAAAAATTKSVRRSGLWGL
ncbi:MAG: FAD-dependent oxidoreductase [Pseudomonadota bacterium]